ncbi:hypothetical protein PspLS_01333 [Pyricularia sp. CBS 133598]|nr:hypothetical protein PspLS_01333 [Pyricularia sp. CBS 133598]
MPLPRVAHRAFGQAAERVDAVAPPETARLHLFALIILPAATGTEVTVVVIVVVATQTLVATAAALRAPAAAAGDEGAEVDAAGVAVPDAGAKHHEQNEAQDDGQADVDLGPGRGRGVGLPEGLFLLDQHDGPTVLGHGGGVEVASRRGQGQGHVHLGPAWLQDLPPHRPGVEAAPEGDGMLVGRGGSDGLVHQHGCGHVVVGRRDGHGGVGGVFEEGWVPCYWIGGFCCQSDGPGNSLSMLRPGKHGGGDLVRRRIGHDGREAVGGTQHRGQRLGGALVVDADPGGRLLDGQGAIAAGQEQQ